MCCGGQKDLIISLVFFADSAGINPDIPKMNLLGIFGSVFLRDNLNGNIVGKSIFHLPYDAVTLKESR